MREALDGIGLSGEEIQQVSDPVFGDNVFQIQSNQLEPGEVKGAEKALASEFGIVRTASKAPASARPSASRWRTAP